MTLKVAAGAIALCGLLSESAVLWSQEPAGARSMFYNPATGMMTSTSPPPAQDKAPPRPVTQTSTVRFVGVHYWIDLEGQGPVADSRSFVSGDRIRLHARSNVDGYLAVWTFDSSGRAMLLLPVGGDLSGSLVKAGRDYDSPAIRFQPPAREERLLLFFARRKAQLPSLDSVDRDGIAAMFDVGARDLVVETEERQAGEIGTYVINRAGGPVAHQITLHHITH